MGRISIDIFLFALSVFLLCGAGSIAFFNSKMLVPIFQSYINDNGMNVSENKG